MSAKPASGGRSGGKLARSTIADVAKRAGVAPSTASLALRGSTRISVETRRKVARAAKALDYCGGSALARSLRAGASNVVGVIVGDSLRMSFRDPLLVRVMDGIATELGERGLGMLLIPVDSVAEPDVVPTTVRLAAMDAAIVLGLPENDAVLAALLARGLPVVAIDGPVATGLPNVAIDDAAGMELLMRHLRELGHSRVGVVSLPLSHKRRHGPLDLADVRLPAYQAGYNRLAALRDLGADPVAVIETTASSVEEGKEAGLELLALSPRPTAIIALSDFLASGVVLAARELGLSAPDDVAIVGFDGLDLPWLAPDVLTSIGQPLGSKGRLAAQMAASAIAGEDHESLVLPVEFKRGTTT